MTRNTQIRRRQIEETSWHGKSVDCAGKRPRRRRLQDKAGSKVSQSQSLTWVKTAKNKISALTTCQKFSADDDEETMSIEFELPSQSPTHSSKDSLDNAKGETIDTCIAKEGEHSVSSVFHDVVADENGRPVLIPIAGTERSRKRVEDFPPETVLSIRVIRFFDYAANGTEIYERELRNVNSGCLLWLPIHLKPGLHSVSGAKYGNWFTVHYLQVYAKHFQSAYIMANEGSSYPAKSFGSTVPAIKGTVKGQELERGYFWFVSPASDGSTSDQQHFDEWGWKHIAREGPFDAKTFMKEWQDEGSPLAARDVQMVLDKVRCPPKQ